MHQFAGIFGPVRLLAIAAAALGLGACSDIRTEPDVQEGGVLEAPTHEQDSLREVEREEEREGDTAQ
jgi:hypothetical protein